ncbi:uncharacterized protein CDAR_303991 [Caerostris darwini]|uniref:Uncharacterized protein n=1 Tax=Caerostris darwini TaxID=1538125 RepID=A0AAV4T536_9ARAC|nr:uncharacterized protein CDAR_303991 [Caerostris darwini]
MAGDIRSTVRALFAIDDKHCMNYALSLIWTRIKIRGSSVLNPFPTLKTLEDCFTISRFLKIFSVPPAKLLSTQRKNNAEAAMASIPVAAYSASKIHEHVKAKQKFEETQQGDATSKMFHQNIFGIEKMLQNYNNKLMNSIWGQYNLYAAHAFQKNNEGSHLAADIFSIPQVKNLWDIRTAH